MKIKILPHLIVDNILQAKIKNKTLVNVSDISEFTNNSDFNKKMKTLVTKAKLKAEKEKNSETLIQIIFMTKVILKTTELKI